MRQPLVLAALAAVLLSGTAMAEPLFNRIATFSVPQNLPADRDPKKKTVSEIIAANGDGTLLAYTDAEQKALGIIDIADPTKPREIASYIPPAAVDPFRTFTDTAQVWGVYVQGNLILASDINAGLFVLGYER